MAGGQSKRKGGAFSKGHHKAFKFRVETSQELEAWVRGCMQPTLDSCRLYSSSPCLIWQVRAVKQHAVDDMDLGSISFAIGKGKGGARKRWGSIRRSLGSARRSLSMVSVGRKTGSDRSTKS